MKPAFEAQGHRAARRGRSTKSPPTTPEATCTGLGHDRQKRRRRTGAPKTISTGVLSGLLESCHEDLRSRFKRELRDKPLLMF